MAKRSSSSEKVKRILLGALGVAFAGAILYQFVLRSPESKPKRTPQPGATTGGSSLPAPASAPGAQKTRQLGAAAQQEALMQALLADLTPLNLRFASSGGSKRE